MNHVQAATAFKSDYCFVMCGRASNVSIHVRHESETRHFVAVFNSTTSEFTTLPVFAERRLADKAVTILVNEFRKEVCP